MTKQTTQKNASNKELLAKQKNGFDLIFKNFCQCQKLRDAENSRAKKGDLSATFTVAKNQEVADYINTNQLSLINLFKNYSFTQNYAFAHSTEGRGKTYEAINKNCKQEKRVFISNFTVTGLFADGVFYRSNFKYGTTTAKQMTIYARDNLHLNSWDTKRIKQVSNEELFNLLKKHKIIKDGAYSYDYSWLAKKYPNYETMLKVKAEV